MQDAHRRIKKVEKQLQIGSRPEWDAVVVLLPTPEEIAADIPEDFHDWITYRKAHKEALERLERNGVELFLFVADPREEYQARLLEQATKDDEKRPNPEK